MSVYDHPARREQTGPAARTQHSSIAQLFLRAFQRWQRRRAITFLQMMDDRQLEDIGISRNEIPRAVDRLFHLKGRSAETPPPLPSQPAEVVHKAA